MCKFINFLWALSKSYTVLKHCYIICEAVRRESTMSARLVWRRFTAECLQPWVLRCGCGLLHSRRRARETVKHSGQTSGMCKEISSGRRPPISREFKQKRMEFCRRKQKLLKEEIYTFKHKAYASKIILLSKYHKICYTLLKHRDLLAWMVVCNTRVKTCLWPPESTPPSHYNVWTCATVGPLCWIAGASKYPRFWDYPLSLKNNTSCTNIILRENPFIRY